MLRPMLIGLVLWFEGRLGFGFRSGHLGKRACTRAQPKVPPHEGMGRLGWWWWVGVRWQQRSSQGQQQSLLVCQHTGQCGLTRRHKNWLASGDCTQGGGGTKAPKMRRALSRLRSNK